MDYKVFISFCEDCVLVPALVSLGVVCVLYNICFDIYLRKKSKKEHFKRVCKLVKEDEDLGCDDCPLYRRSRKLIGCNKRKEDGRCKI